MKRTEVSAVRHQANCFPRGVLAWLALSASHRLFWQTLRVFHGWLNWERLNGSPLCSDLLMTKATLTGLYSAFLFVETVGGEERNHNAQSPGRPWASPLTAGEKPDSLPQRFSWIPCLKTAFGKRSRWEPRGPRTKLAVQWFPHF